MEAAGRQQDTSSPKSVFRCCEDHFDMENDIENWMRHKLIGGKLLLKKGVIPHIFMSQTPEHRDPSPSPRPNRKRRKEEIPLLIDTDADNELQEEDPLGDLPASIKEELSPTGFESSPSIECVEASEDVSIAGYRCDQCRGDIVGFRYCCVQCRHYELCGACEARGHHATHYMLRIPPTKPHRREGVQRRGRGCRRVHAKCRYRYIARRATSARPDAPARASGH